MIEDFNLYGQIVNDFYKYETGKGHSGFLIQKNFD